MIDNLQQPTLFVTDLDGTLLGADSKLSNESTQLLNRAIAAGRLFSVATARTPGTVAQLLARVNVRLTLVVMTGSALWNPQTGLYSDIMHMSHSDEIMVREVCTTAALVPFVYTLTADDSIVHCWHPAAMSVREQKFADERSHLKLKRMHIGDPRYDMVFDNAVLIFATGQWSDIEKCAGRLRQLTDCSVSAYRDIFNHQAGFLEVFAPGVSKWAAVTKLRRLAGARSTVVFGDNLNDIDMLRNADHGVAVGNAFDAVKQVANEVIGTNVSDAVARYIAR